MNRSLSGINHRLRKRRPARLALWITLGFLAASGAMRPPAVRAASLGFYVNGANDYDFGRQLNIPAGFGDGEFTFELWLKADESFPIGPTQGGGSDVINNWTDADITPLSAGNWWFEGNFLLDGFNNSTFQNGTFALQFYGSGRVRWLFGDGVSPGLGDVHSVQASPASSGPNLLDGAWHQLTLVRRWSGSTDADLELWIDGVLIDSVTVAQRTDMRVWWDAWPGYPATQEGWFWGAEKQAAIGILSQYEDYKGLIDEMRFWSRAKGPAEVAGDWFKAVGGSEPGLVGWFEFEGSGSWACDSLTPAQCITLNNMKTGFRDSENSPLGVPVELSHFTIH